MLVTTKDRCEHQLLNQKSDMNSHSVCLFVCSVTLVLPSLSWHPWHIYCFMIYWMSTFLFTLVGMLGHILALPQLFFQFAMNNPRPVLSFSAYGITRHPSDPG